MTLSEGAGHNKGEDYAIVSVAYVSVFVRDNSKNRGWIYKIFSGWIVVGTLTTWESLGRVTLPSLEVCALPTTVR